MRIFYIFLFFCAGILNSYSQIRPYKAYVYDSTLTGYYFLSSAKWSGPKGYNGNIILDSKGNQVYYMQLPFGSSATGFCLQPNGVMTFNYLGRVFIQDSTFNFIDTVVCQNGYATDLHEFQVLPNGHYLLLGDEVVKMDLSSYQYFKGKYGSANANVTCGVVQEMDANKNVVFEWHAKDHFAFSDVDKFYLGDTLNVDWNHCNALELDHDGNILLSVRHFNEITKIDHNTGAIIWRFGGKNNQFTYVSDSLRFWGQHDIRRIANGHITLYDNGWHLISHEARALEYEMDEVNKTADLKWSYIYDPLMYSFATGNVQRVAGSNTLVNYGGISRNNVTCSLVDSLGSKLFELVFDDTIYSYRSFYYPSLPWELHRPVITCFDSAGVTWLDAGPVFDSLYFWNDGSTTRIVPVTKPDTFIVWVHYGAGILASEKLIVTDINNACGTGRVSVITKDDDLKVYPNPVFQNLNINYVLKNSLPVNISIYDISGRVMAEWKSTKESGGRHSISLDVSSCAPGLYFLKMNEKVVKFIKS